MSISNRIDIVLMEYKIHYVCICTRQYHTAMRMNELLHMDELINNVPLCLHSRLKFLEEKI